MENELELNDETKNTEKVFDDFDIVVDRNKFLPNLLDCIQTNEVIHECELDEEELKRMQTAAKEKLTELKRASTNLIKELEEFERNVISSDLQDLRDYYKKILNGYTDLLYFMEFMI